MQRLFKTVIFNNGIDDTIIYNDIESNSSLNIDGDENVHIQGIIGIGAEINLHGDGDTYIQGKVLENVRFNVNGDGNVTFTHRPPESVIKQIKHTGDGNIIIAGEILRKKSSPKRSSYGAYASISGVTLGAGSITTVQAISGQTDRASIDAKVHKTSSTLVKKALVKGQHDRDIDTTSATSFAKLDTSKPTTSAADAKKVEPPIVETSFAYSNNTRIYLESLKGKPSISMQIADLNLTSNEKELFNDFIDPISKAYIEIPVLLNENYYNLNSLLDLHEKIDPVSKEIFTFAEIQPARKLLAQFDTIIEKVKTARIAASTLPTTGATPDESLALIRISGGPSF